MFIHCVCWYGRCSKDHKDMENKVREKREERKVGTVSDRRCDGDEGVGGEEREEHELTKWSRVALAKDSKKRMKNKIIRIIRHTQ